MLSSILACLSGVLWLGVAAARDMPRYATLMGTICTALCVFAAAYMCFRGRVSSLKLAPVVSLATCLMLSVLYITDTLFSNVPCAIYGLVDQYMLCAAGCAVAAMYTRSYGGLSALKLASVVTLATCLTLSLLYMEDSVHSSDSSPLGGALSLSTLSHIEVTSSDGGVTSMTNDSANLGVHGGDTRPLEVETPVKPRLVIHADVMSTGMVSDVTDCRLVHFGLASAGKVYHCGRTVSAAPVWGGGGGERADPYSFAQTWYMGGRSHLTLLAAALALLSLGIAVYSREWCYQYCSVAAIAPPRSAVSGAAGLLALGFLPSVWAVCPVCFDSLPSCKHAETGTCAVDTQVAANAALIIAGATAGLSLASIMRPRWMRVFHLSSINAIAALASRKPPGTVFNHTASTSLKAVVSAISSGQYSLDLAVMKYAELLDECVDDSEEGEGRSLATRLERDLANLSLMSKTGTLSAVAAHSSRDQGGVYSFLWAKISAFVPKRGLDDKVVINTTPSSDAASTASVFTAKLVRAASFSDFTESLNLFIMFSTTLGLVGTLIITDFVQHIVYDTLSVREMPWPVAQELLLITLRRIEDSDGKYNFTNVLDQVYLPTVMEEAMRNAKEAYPKETAAFFRTRGGTPRDANSTDTTSTGKAPVFNGKDTATSKRICPTFNAATKRDHKAKELHPDGTCKCRHVCNHWVKGKGPWGRCMGEKGTPGHSRAECDNPDKCDQPVQ